MRTKTLHLASTVDKSQLRNPTMDIHSWKLSVTVHLLTVLVATKAYLIFEISRGEEVLEKMRGFEIPRHSFQFLTSLVILTLLPRLHVKNQGARDS